MSGSTRAKLIKTRRATRGHVRAAHRVARPGSRIGSPESYDISLAGVAALRLLAMAGAGGIALTAWALDRSGMNRRALASGLTRSMWRSTGSSVAAVLSYRAFACWLPIIPGALAYLPLLRIVAGWQGRARPS